MSSQQKEAILAAINDAGRRVTAADIATRTGLPILKVTSELNKIAEETRGHLEVATTGDIAYRFSPAFQTTYLATGIRKHFDKAWQWTLKAAGFLLRISFGIGLILSVITLGILVFLVIKALSSGGGGDRDDGFDFGLDLNFFDYLILRDLLYWGVYANTYDYYGQDYYGQGRQQQRGSGNFLFNCFSFLFGDGNPNQNLEERKWQIIAQVIRQNGGSVSAEQLAPYTGTAPGDEDGMLPVLVRFDGRPEVTESGNIVYQFPSLQVKAAADAFGSAPVYLEERAWPFTNASIGSLVPVFILAGINFIGSWWALGHIVLLNTLYGLGPLVIVLLFYGNAFLLVPFIRWIALQFVNSGIKSRNAKRQGLANLLAHPSPELLRKLGDAKHLRIKEEKIGTDNLVYTTEKGALEQKDDLDAQFEKLESSKVEKVEAKPEIIEEKIELGGSEPITIIETDMEREFQRERDKREKR